MADSLIDAAHSAAQTLAFQSHLVLQHAAREDGETVADLEDGRIVLAGTGSGLLAELAKHVLIVKARVTHAQQILDAESLLLEAEPPPKEVSIGPIHAASSHEAVLKFAHYLVNLAWHVALDNQIEPAGESDPSTWTSAVWPKVRPDLAPLLGQLDLDRVRVVLKQEAARARKSERSTRPADAVECHVTLSQMSAMVNKSKRTLERLRDNGKLPKPDVKGGDGVADEWRWPAVRPILESEYKRQLPEVFPSDRFVRR